MVPLPEQSVRLFLRGRNLGAGLRLHHDGIHRICIRLLHADHFPFGSGDRKQNDIVLVLSLGRLSFPREYADDRERNVLDSDRLADRIGAIEQIVDRRLSQHSDFVGAVHIRLRKLSASGHREIANGQVVGSNAVDKGRPVVVSVDYLGSASNHGCRECDIGTLRHKFPGVGLREGNSIAGA